MLDNNQLRYGELLAPIGRMGNPQRLSLAHNKLVSLPESIGQLRALTDLGVHNNALIELPASLGRLCALERPSAQNNCLAFLPESFAQLNELKTASLSDNRLQRLPPSIASGCCALEKLEVAHNPLQRPPITVVRQGVTAVRRFFQDLSRSGSLPARSGQLVLPFGERQDLPTARAVLRPAPSGRDCHTTVHDLLRPPPHAHRRRGLGGPRRRRDAHHL